MFKISKWLLIVKTRAQMVNNIRFLSLPITWAWSLVKLDKTKLTRSILANKDSSLCLESATTVWLPMETQAIQIFQSRLSILSIWMLPPFPRMVSNSTINCYMLSMEAPIWLILLQAKKIQLSRNQGPVTRWMLNCSNRIMWLHHQFKFLRFIGKIIKIITINTTKWVKGNKVRPLQFQMPASLVVSPVSHIRK